MTVRYDERTPSPAATTSAIRLEGVGKRYPLDKGTFVALENVNLEIAERTFCTLIGPSGCGKSTLLRLVADLLEPTEGRIQVLGRSAAEARAARDFGFVFQDPVLLPWRSALANVELPMVVNKVPKAERRERAMDLLQLVGLGGFETALPAKLSGGMARRVAIARALTRQPRVLFLDEPFNGLDEIRRQSMNEELQRIWLETDTTAVLVTHNVSEAVFLSDKVVVMGKMPGRVLTEMDIDLPRPRTVDTLTEPRFVEYERELTALLRRAYDEADT
jgi:NitT/TauT family transport system ATP-binding protein